MTIKHLQGNAMAEWLAISRFDGIAFKNGR